ncbi:hypothetical protein [Cytobacillus oceanisediminis]|uniref:hypothetical protein n=1 Tax=Cytobacillus oceanisediminis TaxID=665099 RepID=UPI0020406851|nr:hypothetical protein [Cytobacillus oceanisediminis]MCM3405935.1 hypothetical protein [Cytobacillus oceanisediminis]
MNVVKLFGTLYPLRCIDGHCDFLEKVLDKLKPSKEAAQKMYKIFEKVAIRVAKEQKKNDQSTSEKKEK